MGAKRAGKDAAEQKRAIESIPEQLDPRFYVREDGALCWGGDCLVIKPDGKDLRITINEENCGGLAFEAYGKAIEETIGRGGKTIYEVPAKIDRQEDTKPKKARQRQE